MLNFGHQRILCLGDVVLDRFHYGTIERISPEAPVPVVRLVSTKVMLGGAGNVARNIASLGGEAVLVGVVGQDFAGREMEALIAATPGIIDANIRTARRPTTCKTRVIATHQHVVRLDEEVATPIGRQEIADITAHVEHYLPGCQALVVSDYAKGLLEHGVVAHAIGLARGLGLPVFVDPKRDDFAFYHGATVLTPNLKELQAAARAEVDTDDQVVAAARSLIDAAGCDAILVTRSEKGMLLLERDGGVHIVPARAREVFDVSGAGDTVVAVAALAAAAGYTLPQAMRIANSAAGIVVGKLGTATVDLEDLVAAFGADTAENTEVLGKIVTVAQAASVMEAWRRRGLTIGFTNGCFDILHRGHVTMLAAARAACDRLVVALNTDDSVRRLKGASRPVNPLDDRSVVAAALQSVDLVVAFDEDTPLKLITRLVPDVLFKGADYRLEDVVGADVVTSAGGRVQLLNLVPGQSTTEIIARSRAAPAVA